MFLRFQVFDFEGQNMTFTVNVLLSCILYCDVGSAAIRAVCKVQYRPKVSYHLLSHFSRDGSPFSRDVSPFSRDVSHSLENH